jgi:hypothetical protein
MCLESSEDHVLAESRNLSLNIEFPESKEVLISLMDTQKGFT